MKYSQPLPRPPHNRTTAISCGTITFRAQEFALAIGGAIAKTIWDKLMACREELARIRRDKKIQRLERQLSEFYWPLYIRLEKDRLIWEKVFDQNSGIDSAVQKPLETTQILPRHPRSRPDAIWSTRPDRNI